MRKRFFIFCAVLLLAGCAKEVFEVPAGHQRIIIDENAPSFYASVSGGTTKTYIGSDVKLHWTAEDLVSVFNSSTTNQEYVFTGQTGDRGGSSMKMLSRD